MDAFQPVETFCKAWLDALSKIHARQPPEIILNAFKAVINEIQKLSQSNRREIDYDNAKILSSLLEALPTFPQNDLFSQVMQSVLNCFVDEWKTPILILLNVEICLGHLLQIKHGISIAKDYSTCLHIKKSLKCIDSIIGSYSSKGALKSGITLLCFNQILSNLPLFVKSYERACPQILVYATTCLIECLGKVKKEPWELSNQPCCEFLDLMDVALGSLDEVAEHPKLWIHDGTDRMTHLKKIIDELLCHSMSTAQVTNLLDDQTNILSKSQKILSELENLQDNLVSEDEATVRFSANIVSDALCSLERAVNGAVLRLLLHVECDLEDPIKLLVRECKPDDSTRSALSLEHLIIQLDSYMDKLMQIGSFAVSCTSNLKKSMLLKSCMASFESLESELVPSITNLYLQSTPENQHKTRLLVYHWQQELAKFRNILFKIVDPATYTEIVQQYVKQHIRQLNTNSHEINSFNVKKIAKAAKTLIYVIMASTAQDQNDVENKNLKRFSHLINNASKQCIILGNQSESEKKLILQQLEHLDTVVSDLWQYLAEKITHIDDSSTASCKENESTAAGEMEYYKLCPADSTLDLIDRADSALAPQIARGQLLIKEAVFYSTPKRCPVTRTPLNLTAAMRSAGKPTSVIRRRCFRTALDDVANATDVQPNMELTALLEKLTFLEDTFSEGKTAKRAHIAPKFEEEPASITTSQSVTLMDTPDRMRDLMLVENKLGNLRSIDIL